MHVGPGRMPRRPVFSRRDSKRARTQLYYKMCLTEETGSNKISGLKLIVRMDVLLTVRTSTWSCVTSTSIPKRVRLPQACGHTTFEILFFVQSQGCADVLLKIKRPDFKIHVQTFNWSMALCKELVRKNQSALFGMN